MKSPFVTVEQAIEIVKAGRMLILMDDENRENEGDLIVSADHITPEIINFMARFGRGLICLPMASQLIDKLQLPMMVNRNQSPYGTAFTVSIEAAEGVSTGISAQDRARTIQLAVDPESGPADLISPGHIFPLRAVNGGVLKRPGQTEGSVDLMRLAGLSPAAVICEVMNEDGTMSRLDDLVQFSEQHQIPLLTIKDLIEYRIRHEILIQEKVTTKLPIQTFGDFSMTVFSNDIDLAEHFALSKPFQSNQPPLVRIHSECLTGDVLGSCKCDCGLQLQESIAQIGAQGGILIYLRQEGRGIGLTNKLKAYALQAEGYDTVDANLQLGLPADNREYGIAYQILKYFAVLQIRLLTNNPEKIKSIEKYGVAVSERIPLIVPPTEENQSYLKAKKYKLGHLFND